MQPWKVNTGQGRSSSDAVAAGGAGHDGAVEADDDGAPSEAYSSCAGDSVLDEGEDEGEPECKKKRTWPKDPTPKVRFVVNPDFLGSAHELYQRTSEESREDDTSGNISWSFLNNGKRAKHTGLREKMDITLKKNPGQIVGMAECEEETEEVLRSSGVPGDPTAPNGSMERRDSYEYLTLRGEEEDSNLLAVRRHVAVSLELLHFEKINLGLWKQKTDLT